MADQKSLSVFIIIAKNTHALQREEKKETISLYMNNVTATQILPQNLNCCLLIANVERTLYILVVCHLFD